MASPAARAEQVPPPAKDRLVVDWRLSGAYRFDRGPDRVIPDS